MTNILTGSFSHSGPRWEIRLRRCKWLVSSCGGDDLWPCGQPDVVQVRINDANHDNLSCQDQQEPQEYGGAVLWHHPRCAGPEADVRLSSGVVATLYMLRYPNRIESKVILTTEISTFRNLRVISTMDTDFILSQDLRSSFIRSLVIENISEKSYIWIEYKDEPLSHCNKLHLAEGLKVFWNRFLISCDNISIVEYTRVETGNADYSFRTKLPNSNWIETIKMPTTKQG